MVHTITVSDEVFSRLQSLARPFEDKEPEDVIRRLLEAEPTTSHNLSNSHIADSEHKTPRLPRERGAIVKLNGDKITATTVPDLCTKVMEFIESKGLWTELEKLAPYKTSAKRYLFSKNPQHPLGNDFFVPLKFKNIYFEGHKNYETTITQLNRLMLQLGVNFEYVS